MPPLPSGSARGTNRYDPVCLTRAGPRCEHSGKESKAAEQRGPGTACPNCGTSTHQSRDVSAYSNGAAGQFEAEARCPEAIGLTLHTEARSGELPLIGSLGC